VKVTELPPAIAPGPEPSGDSVRPAEAIAEMVGASKVKSLLSERDLVIRGALAGAFLGFATALVQVVIVQGALPFVAALLFPVGFVILVLMGLELATGNFAVMPMGLADKRFGLGALVRNWVWVYIGNLLGALLFAFLFYAVSTKFGGDGGPLAKQITTVVAAKTTAYQAAGMKGWFTALFKGVLCNWMVTMGVVMAFFSRSTIGRIAAMWLPILIFFALGLEHSIVNMFLISAGMLFGSGTSFGTWWIWNQIPVTVGNIIGGALFTGLALYATYKPKPVTAAA
jgi:formate/nitrite transporter